MEKLYKYTRINANTLSSLLDRYAWYPKPSTLNDPFDCGLSLSLMNGNDQWGVLSLSAIYSNIMMWSHYADSHRGLCIEYTDYTDLQLEGLTLNGIINPVKSSVSELPIIRNATPVQYLSTENLNIQMESLPQSLEDFNRCLMEYNTGPHTEVEYRNGFVVRQMQSLFVKHEDWKYEKEYRIVVQEGNKAIPSPGVVTTIYLGMCASEMECQQIYRIGLSLGAKVLKMERVPKKYELSPRELTPNEKQRPNLEYCRSINSHVAKYGEASDIHL